MPIATTLFLHVHRSSIMSIYLTTPTPWTLAATNTDAQSETERGGSQEPQSRATSPVPKLTTMKSPPSSLQPRLSSSAWPARKSIVCLPSTPSYASRSWGAYATNTQTCPLGPSAVSTDSGESRSGKIICGGRSIERRRRGWNLPFWGVGLMPGLHSGQCENIFGVGRKHLPQQTKKKAEEETATEKTMKEFQREI